MDAASIRMDSRLRGNDWLGLIIRIGGQAEWMRGSLARIRFPEYLYAAGHRSYVTAMPQSTTKRAGAKATGRSKEKKPTKPVYEPPRLTKFDKLEKLIVCGE